MGVRGSATCPAYDTASDQLRNLQARLAPERTRLVDLNIVLLSSQVWRHVDISSAYRPLAQAPGQAAAPAASASSV